MLQNTIQEAEDGDFEEIDRLLKLYRSPFDENMEMHKYATSPPIGLRNVISCSS
jgi:uncharacterized protein YdiU (UPF0061 family)